MGFSYTATENQEEIARRIGNHSREEKKEADSGQEIHEDRVIGRTI